MVIKLKPGIAFFLTAMLMANLTACGQKENTNAVGTEKPCRESGTVRYCYSWFSLYFLSLYLTPLTRLHIDFWYSEMYNALYYIEF